VFDPSLFEGFGFPVIEAMACGAPVICSNTSSLLEISEGRTPNFDPYSVEDIYSCLTKTLESSHYLQDTEKNFDYANSFCWDRTAKNVYASYEKSLAGL
jgi:alpha-1,3-rhamnosyl/mannosyltransferase